MIEKVTTIVHDVFGETQAHRGQHSARVTLDDLENAVRGCLDQFCFLLRRNENGSIGDLGPNVVPDQNDHRGEPEGNAPAPTHEGFVRERRRQDQQHDRRHQVAHRHAGLRPRRPESARSIRAVLGDQEYRPTPFAADRESLDEAQRDQHCRRPVADLTVGRQAAHQERCGADQQQTELQQLLSAEFVSEVSEDDSAEWPGGESDGVGDESRDDRIQLVAAAGEEDLAEDQRGRRAVQKELVPLDHGARHRGADHLLQPRWRGLALGFRHVVDAHRGLPRLQFAIRLLFTIRNVTARTFFVTR